MKRVGVLGCGPSGLIAAYVCEQLGMEIRIWSRKQRSFIAGAQYLHEPVLGIQRMSGPDALLRVEKKGTREGYARKVYGDPLAPVSWDQYQHSKYPAWNLRKTYDRLWSRFCDRIVDTDLNGLALEDLIAENSSTILWVNTIPLPALCVESSHRFFSQKVHILQRRQSSRDSFIIYDGRPASPYYRMSVIFGHLSVEWPGSAEKPCREAVTIKKPLTSECDCWAERSEVLLQGRYGAWNKNMLTNHVARNVAKRVGERVYEMH